MLVNALLNELFNVFPNLFLLKLFEITISYHSSGVNTLQCHFMNKNLKSFVSRCECVSCFDNILVVNPEERFAHDAAQKKLGSCFWVGFD